MASYCLSILLLASALSGTLAQYGTAASSTSTSTAAAASASASASTIHQVAVGKNGLVFTPDTLNAAPGDTVEFTFAAGHSVTLSTFSNPCQAATENAIFSGFPPSTEMFALKINDTNPLWLYCAQVSHCQSGMAMVINPPSSGGNTLAAYKAAAASTTSSTAPPGVEGGLLLPVGAALASGSSSSAAASTSAAGSTTAAASTPSSTKSSAANNLADNMKWAVGFAALLAWLFRV